MKLTKDEHFEVLKSRMAGLGLSLSWIYNRLTDVDTRGYRLGSNNFSGTPKLRPLEERRSHNVEQWVDVVAALEDFITDVNARIEDIKDFYGEHVESKREDKPCTE
ncbi:MAG: hypothetical protein AB7S38_28925 [Vulcanimicrobiota bacterium]